MNYFKEYVYMAFVTGICCDDPCTGQSIMDYPTLASKQVADFSILYEEPSLYLQQSHIYTVCPSIGLQYCCFLIINGY